MARDLSKLTDAELAQAAYRVQNPGLAGGLISSGIFGRRGSRILLEEAQRQESRRQSVFDLMDNQVNQMRGLATTPEDKAAVNNFDAMAQFARLSRNAGGAEDFLKLTGQWIAKNEEQTAARDAIDRTEQTRVETNSDQLREKMYKELDPVQIGIDSYRGLLKLVDVHSPFATVAAAYQTVQLLQFGTGSRIAKDDVELAQSGIDTWLGWVTSKLSAGATGEGFTEEAANNLMAVLQPLVDVASDHAARIAGRYGAIASQSGYDSARVFAGFNPDDYAAGKYTPKRVPTREETQQLNVTRLQAVTEAGKEASTTVGAFMNGLLGLDPVTQKYVDERGRMFELIDHGNGRKEWRQVQTPADARRQREIEAGAAVGPVVRTP